MEKPNLRNDEKERKGKPFGQRAVGRLCSRSGHDTPHWRKEEVRRRALCKRIVEDWGGGVVVRGDIAGGFLFRWAEAAEAEGTGLLRDPSPCSGSDESMGGTSSGWCLELWSLELGLFVSSPLLPTQGE